PPPALGNPRRPHRPPHLATVGPDSGPARARNGAVVSAVSDTDTERLALPPQTREAVLDIRDLSIAYRSGAGDVRAVRHVDLALGLPRGGVVGLAGESGCGKSTLAYGSIRLLRPPAVITGGSVTYRGARVGPEGVDVLAADAERLRKLRWREIAIVFQSAMNS